MIGKAIYSLLSSVGRLEPMRVLQAVAEPYMVYQVISNSPSDTKSGVSKLDVVRLQVSVFGNTYAEVDALATTVRTTLDRYRGTKVNTVIDHIVFENEVDMFDDGAAYYHRAVDFFVRVKK